MMADEVERVAREAFRDKWIGDSAEMIAEFYAIIAAAEQRGFKLCQDAAVKVAESAFAPGTGVGSEQMRAARKIATALRTQRNEVVEECARVCLDVRDVIGAAHGSSIGSALAEAATAIRNLKSQDEPTYTSGRGE